jgi:hypothetical protein
MMRMRYILGILVLFAATSCGGVNLDFSNLSFEPGGGSGDDTGTTTPDIETSDVPAVEDVDREASGGDTTPETRSEARCWDIFECVLFEKQDLELTETSFNQCSGSEDWLGQSAVLNLRGCLDDCMVSKTWGEIGTCLGAKCIDETLSCVNDEDGDKDCADAMLCTVEECAQFADGEKEQVDCMVGCFGDMDHMALPDLKGVLKQCMAAEDSESFECQEAVYSCYAGSGVESCYDVLSCIDECNKECIGLPNEEECKSDGTCANGCIYGISEDAAETLLEMGRCNVFDDHNVFSCLVASATCLHDHMGGFATCQATVKSLSNSYYSTALGHEQKYHLMASAITGVKPASFDAIMEVLKCLQQEWENTPGYGKIPEPDWNGCATKCG